MSTPSKFILLITAAAVLLASGIWAATKKPALEKPVVTYKVSGTFDIPKKEYRVGETVRGKFTFVNQERAMTVNIKG